MNKFLVGYILGLLVGLALSYRINYHETKRVTVDCSYNDKTIPVDIEIDGLFSNLEAQELYGSTCKALKAFRECNYLRAYWPKAKEYGTRLFTHDIMTFRRANVNKDFCAYTVGAIFPHRISIAMWNNDVCPSLAAIIFHESLHLAGLPKHNYKMPLSADPIEQTVNACLGQ